MSNGRTISQIYSELVSNPFFPLLFISEAIKEGTVAYTAIDPVVVYAILAVVATVLWALSDTVDVDVETTDNGFFK